MFHALSSDPDASDCEPDTCCSECQMGTKGCEVVQHNHVTSAKKKQNHNGKRSQHDKPVASAHAAVTPTLVQDESPQPLAEGTAEGIVR
jgi:hypothetical protein